MTGASVNRKRPSEATQPAKREAATRARRTDKPQTYSSPAILARRRRILEETRRLIAEQGLVNFNMNELCKRAGVAFHGLVPLEMARVYKPDPAAYIAGDFAALIETVARGAGMTLESEMAPVPTGLED